MLGREERERKEAFHVEEKGGWEFIEIKLVEICQKFESSLP